MQAFTILRKNTVVKAGRALFSRSHKHNHKAVENCSTWKQARLSLGAGLGHVEFYMTSVSRYTC